MEYIIVTDNVAKKVIKKIPYSHKRFAQEIRDTIHKNHSVTTIEDGAQQLTLEL